MRRVPRRTVLRRALAAATTAGAGAFAGCGALEPDSRGTYEVPDRETVDGEGSTGQDSVRFEPVSIPEPGPPRPRRWLPAPSELALASTGPGDEQPPAYSAWGYDFETLRGQPELVPENYDVQQLFRMSGLDYFGFGPEAINGVVRLELVGSHAAVIEGEFEPATVETTLSETGYRLAGSHAGYRLFVRDDGPRATAVGSNALVWSRVQSDEADDAPGAVLSDARSIVDAASGSVPRYHEVDEGFERLSRLTGAPVFSGLVARERRLTGANGQVHFEGVVALGGSMSFDADRTYVRTALEFDRELEESRARRRGRRLLADRELARVADAAQVAVDGTGVELRMAVPDEAFADLVGTDRHGRPPRVTWGFAAERPRILRSVEDRSDLWWVTVTHEGGDEIPAEMLRVGSGREYLLEFSEALDVVGPGDTITFTHTADPGPRPERLHILYGPSRDRTTSRLATYVIT